MYVNIVDGQIKIQTEILSKFWINQHGDPIDLTVLSIDQLKKLGWHIPVETGQRDYNTALEIERSEIRVEEKLPVVIWSYSLVPYAKMAALAHFEKIISDKIIQLRSTPVALLRDLLDQEVMLEACIGTLPIPGKPAYCMTVEQARLVLKDIIIKQSDILAKLLKLYLNIQKEISAAETDAEAYLFYNYGIKEFNLLNK